MNNKVTCDKRVNVFWGNILIISNIVWTLEALLHLTYFDQSFLQPNGLIKHQMHEHSSDSKLYPELSNTNLLNKQKHTMLNCKLVKYAICIRCWLQIPPSPTMLPISSQRILMTRTDEHIKQNIMLIKAFI